MKTSVRFKNWVMQFANAIPIIPKPSVNVITYATITWRKVVDIVVYMEIFDFPSPFKNSWITEN